MPRHFERDEAGLGSGHGIGAQEFICQDRETIDADGLKTLVERSGFARGFDPRLYQSEIFVEDCVLQRDRQRKNAIEPALDRGEIVGQPAIGVFKPEAGTFDEVTEVGGFELALIEQLELAAERIARIVAFEIVGRVEQVLTARLALAARQRAQGIEPSRNGRDEAAFALHVGGYRPEQRGRGLVGAVRATETLDGVVGAPSRFKQEVNPALLIPTAEVGMIGTPRAARIGEDQDTFGPFHEALRFGDIGTGTTPFETLLTIAARYQPAGPARNLGDGLGPEMLDDRVERSGDGRQCAELFDQHIARGKGTRAENGIALSVAHCLGAKIAVLVGEDLHQSYREALRKVVDDVFFAVAVYVERRSRRRGIASVCHDFTPDNCGGRGSVAEGYARLRTSLSMAIRVSDGGLKRPGLISGPPCAAKIRSFSSESARR